MIKIVCERKFFNSVANGRNSAADTNVFTSSKHICLLTTNKTSFIFIAAREKNATYVVARGIKNKILHIHYGLQSISSKNKIQITNLHNG